MVTADDLEAAVAAAVAALAAGAEHDWTRNAGPLEWTCWETAEHLADDLFGYALQLGPKKPSLDGYLPIVMSQRREGAPGTAILVEPEAGVARLLETLEACGGLLAAMVRVSPPEHRAYHSSAVTDPEGYAAMGLTELLAHTDDICKGLDISFVPDEALCDRVLRRLFPDAPGDTPRWQTFLWCTGRGDLPGRPRLTTWHWQAEPR